MRAWFLSSMLFLVACSGQGPSSPPPPPACVAGACPTGYACEQGQCLKTCIAESPTCDAGYRCVADVCMPCEGTGCGSPALKVQLASTPACITGMGYVSNLHPKVVGCHGSFSSGLVTMICAPGWYICKAAPRELCDALPGFFMSQLPAAQGSPWPPDSTLRCSWDGSSNNSPRGVAGCGFSIAGGTMTASSAQCGSMPTVQACGQGGWHCPAGSPPKDSDFASISNDNAQDGILCCAP